MGIKIHNPTSAGRRESSSNDWSELSERGRQPKKSLVQRLTRHGGRNHHGFITSRHRGGGARRLYRLIDFKRRKDNVTAVVESVEYDPNRSCHIALVRYTDGEQSYILAPGGLKAGMKVESGVEVEPKVGNCMPIRNIPSGLEIHNVELNVGQGGKMARSAGTACRLVGKEAEWATLALPSGELRQVRVECRATIGQLGNTDHQNVRVGKAGRTRHMGIRPTVRGTAQNPVSHPLGGGEGRSGGGRHPVSKWGQLAKGGRTRSPRKISKKRILRRRWSRRYGLVSIPGKKK